MCGICLLIIDATHCTSLDEIHEHVYLKNRGPDAETSKQIALNEQYTGQFTGYTLHFRGTLTHQPIADDAGNLLLWNGEIFGGIKVEKWENDGTRLLELLKNCNDEHDVLHTVVKIQGPWALVYWQEKTKTLWMGRDVFGRRSLVYSEPGAGIQLCLASVAVTEHSDWLELPADGIYSISYKSDLLNGCQQRAVWYPWLQNMPDSSPGTVVLDHVRQAWNKNNSCAEFKCMEVTEGPYGLISTILPFNRQPPDGHDAVVCKHEESNHTREPPGSDYKKEGTNVTSKVTLTQQICSGSVQDGDPQDCNKRGDKLGTADSGRGSDTQALLGVKDIKLGTGDSDRVSGTHAPLGARDIMSLASREDLVRADQLLDVLGQAVRLRVECQADSCHVCLQAQLSTNKSYSSIKQASVDSFVSDCYMQEDTLHNMTCIDSLTKAWTRDVKIDARPHESCTKSCHAAVTSEDSVINSMLPANQTENYAVSAIGNVHSVSDKTSQATHHHLHDDYVCTDNVASAVGERVTTPCQHARVAILFSGGIDSLVLTALADRYVPAGEPIDLLNVAFQQQQKAQQQPKHKARKHRQPESSRADPYAVPDRLTGYAGLQVLNPDRQWNFVEVNVTLEELQDARSEHVCHLVRPLTTVLDDSIGCAIWFAARGKGLLTTAPGGTPIQYTSTARVLLVGMGADEQFAGYSRHRTKFSNGGWMGLIEEIQMEIERISARNLGRDDRVISDHSRESRFPFLDENVVSFLNSLPVWHKANLNLPRGLGEKFLLRVAAAKLGLGASAVLPKRAIQFGSRIAKMENSKEKASDTCSRLKHS